MKLTLEIPDGVLGPLMQKHLETGIPVQSMVLDIMKDHLAMNQMVTKEECAIFALTRGVAGSYTNRSGFVLIYKDHTDFMRDRKRKGDDDED